MKSSLKHITNLVKAASDPNRLKILYLLKNRPLCVCELTEILKLAQPTVSRHLKTLEYANLVRSQREGSWMIYHLDEQNEIASIIIGSILSFLEEDPDLLALAGKAKTVSRYKIKK